MVRKKRKFSKEFKRKMVNLYNSGSSQKEIREEYDLSPSVLARWIKESQDDQHKQSNNYIKNSSGENTSQVITSSTIEVMKKDLKQSYSLAEELQEQLQKEKDKIKNIEITLETLTSYLK
nr:transposase [Mammaliicoccus lentus]